MDHVYLIRLLLLIPILGLVLLIVQMMCTLRLSSLLKLDLSL
uniref:Uncharacterized protein n=1 Tax=Arundo donax TaxID=35708 RepID=A0A0A9GAT0_ARUDO